MNGTHGSGQLLAKTGSPSGGYVITTISRVLKYILYTFAALAAVIVLIINCNLASLAQAIYPGSLWWTHGVLLLLEAVAFYWLWQGIFGGHKHLLLQHDDNEADRKQFQHELLHRMRSNQHVKDIAPDGPEDSERINECMTRLREMANKEIEEHAKRVFLATALSQNGRLDALIVFFSLCRLVWRISAIYNQRPHPREISSLFWAVASSTFLALSLEELHLTTEIGVGFSQIAHAVAPAGVSSSIPFAGKALQIFISSAMEGTINCYLALRAGIITRNAFDYALANKQRASRGDVYREAGSHLLTMSASMMGKLRDVSTEALTEAVKNAPAQAVQRSKVLVHGLGSAVGNAKDQVRRIRQRNQPFDR